MQADRMAAPPAEDHCSGRGRRRSDDEARRPGQSGGADKGGQHTAHLPVGIDRFDRHNAGAYLFQRGSKPVQERPTPLPSYEPPRTTHSGLHHSGPPGSRRRTHVSYASPERSCGQRQALKVGVGAGSGRQGAPNTQ